VKQNLLTGIATISISLTGIDVNLDNIIETPASISKCQRFLDFICKSKTFARNIINVKCIHQI
jgi:hypothetical protein